MKSTNRTVFVSAFPIDAPRYVVFALLDEPKGIKETYNFATAGWNAAPTVGDIIAKIGPMLGVYPIGHTDNFQPLVALMQNYTNPGGHDDYSAPVLMKAAAKPVDVYAETTRMDPVPTAPETNADSDAIGDLIGDLPAGATAKRGPGAAN
jgi:hypothetical protein